MPKLELDRVWIYAGVYYGPGITEVPDEAAEAIRAKGGDLSAPVKAARSAEKDAEEPADGKASKGGR